MEFPKDEVKNKIVWTKGADFTDGSPRYTFEGRDPATTYERFQVVIYTERERRYAHDPGSLCNHYYGYVRDDKMECAETIGPYYSVREAKRRTLELFNSFVQQYAAQELDSTTPESGCPAYLHTSSAVFPLPIGIEDALADHHVRNPLIPV